MKAPFIILLALVLVCPSCAAPREKVTETRNGATVITERPAVAPFDAALMNLMASPLNITL